MILSREQSQKNKQPEHGFLTVHIDEFPTLERNLAALYFGVSAGLSRKTAKILKWQSYAPDIIVKGMQGSGYIDREILQALNTAKNDGNYSTSDYVKALVRLSDEATKIILNKPPKGGTQVHKYVTDNVRSVGLTTLTATGLGEGALLLTTGRPSVALAVGIFVGSITSRGFGSEKML